MVDLCAITWLTLTDKKRATRENLKAHLNIS